MKDDDTSFSLANNKYTLPYYSSLFIRSEGLLLLLCNVSSSQPLFHCHREVTSLYFIARCRNPCEITVHGGPLKKKGGNWNATDGDLRCAPEGEGERRKTNEKRF